MSDPYAECRRVLAQHSKSFSLAARLFPADRRDEASAVYAWCRECDDAIDLSPPERHRAELDRLHAELTDIYAGEPQPSPVRQAFQAVTRARGIPREYPAELLAGMAMDVENPPYETLDDLLLYAYRVAGVVGLMMCHVMGVSEERATLPAAHLGIAMQITNVCRDVLEDWERGRLYIPSELLSADLARALRDRREDTRSAPTAGDLPDKARQELAAAAERLLSLASQYYTSADAGMALLSPRSALAVRTARLVYAEIGREIERRHYDVLSGRAVVGNGRKIALLARAVARYARDSARPSLRRRPVAPPERLLPYSEAVRLG